MRMLGGSLAWFFGWPPESVWALDSIALRYWLREMQRLSRAGRGPRNG